MNLMKTILVLFLICSTPMTGLARSQRQNIDDPAAEDFTVLAAAASRFDARRTHDRCKLGLMKAFVTLGVEVTSERFVRHHFAEDYA